MGGKKVNLKKKILHLTKFLMLIHAVMLFHLLAFIKMEAGRKAFLKQSLIGFYSGFNKLDLTCFFFYYYSSFLKQYYMCMKWPVTSNN